MAVQGLVPFLPDDVARQCLLRVPVQSLSQMQRVSRRWRELVNSSEFYEERRKEGATSHCVCMLQFTGEASGHGDPLFGVSLLRENNWDTRLPPIPNTESVPLFSRFAAVGGHLVVLGGWSPVTMAELRSVHIFSFSSWTWRRGADMPTTRSFFACSVVQGAIIVVGGHDANKNAVRTAERYHLDSDWWESLPDMHDARDECASVVLDDKLVVISGYGTSSQGEFRRDAEVFDLERRAWRQIHHMWPKGVSPSTAVAVAGKLVAVHNNLLVCYKGEDWYVVDAVPDDEHGISSAVCATAFGNSVVVTGPSILEDGSHRVLIYRLPEDGLSKGKWESVPVDVRFRGIAHVSCVVEV